MPEGANSEIPNKNTQMTPEAKPDILTPVTRRAFIKGAAAVGTAAVVESTIGKVIPAEAKQEAPTTEPEKAGGEKERTPEQEAYDAKAACENLFINVRKIEGMDLKTVDFASKSASGETDDFQEANNYLSKKQYVEAKASFQEVSNRLLALAAVRILNQIRENKGLVYSWDDIDKAKAWAFNTEGQPLSEIRNYLDTCTPLVDSNIESYFWRGIPVKRGGKVIPIYSQPTYVENINETAFMVGGFSGKDPEIIMGAFLATPPEKPKYPDVSGHSNYVYDWVESSNNNLRGHRLDKGLFDLIKDLLRLPVEERKVVYIRTSEMTPIYR